ncbi:MAG: hypothetical protein LBI63_00935 [Candidatus Ancillula sp.]|jgi:hypothetical protein|nr:hypothetical protein [Candidatus Ancillula sp.]
MVESNVVSSVQVGKDELVALIDDLVNASADYYHSSRSSGLSDDEYDDKLEYLRQCVADADIEFDDEHTKLLDGLMNKVSSGTSAPIDDLAADDFAANGRVLHKIPMLSLQKANTYDEIVEFLDKTKQFGADELGWVLQAKLDGLAIEARYENGVLKQLITRGDGHYGQDISWIIEFMRAKIRTVEGLPIKLKGKFGGVTLSLRGEIFMTKEQFAFINDQRWACASVTNSVRLKLNEQKKKTNMMRTEQEKVNLLDLIDEDSVRLKTARNATAGQLNQDMQNVYKEIQMLKKKVESGEVKPTEDYNRLVNLADKLLGGAVAR